MPKKNQKKQGQTVQDILDLLAKNGAGRDKKSSIRIWDYDQLIPNTKVLNGLKKIGNGGYGTVYEIQIEGLKYALKIMTQKQGITQQQLIDTFYNECKQLLSVNHVRVLRLIGVVINVSEEGSYCFCHYTNYYEKGNLYDIIRKKQLFPEAPQGSNARFFKKVRLLSQIAEGIHAIHAVDLIHRDIKSQNILLDEMDSPKIADLGLTEDFQFSLASKIQGTYQWMAPEI